ncbi:MAG TPA: glycosyltransferase family 4 protein [Steroidobacteraceae bacterium]|nr:glycosyltransferase family 4 protein [Steroidobacteraceae bacterium]
MTNWTFATAAAALIASFLLTLATKRAAGRLGLIDVPNGRSSHAVPTPTGGGLAIVVSSTLALGLLAAVGIISTRLFLALAPGGIAVAAVGFIDDRKSLPARYRLLVHFIAAAWAVACIGPVHVFNVGHEAPGLNWLDYVVSTVGIAWFLNMFNFMDGIDAIAASEAVFLCAGTSLLALFSAAVSYIAGGAIVIGAASAGFLLWNWPPARTFMGDVGSGYLGFTFAVLGVAGGTHSGSALCSCLILAGVFVVDSTFTLVRRFMRGERITEAHRTHAFQVLAQRMGHRNVTLAVGLVNVAWLLPCGLASVLWPQDVMWITAAALCPVILGAFAIGAGRPERLPVAPEPSAVVIQFSAPAALKRRTSPVVAQEYHRQYSSPDIADRSASDVG